MNESSIIHVTFQIFTIFHGWIDVHTLPTNQALKQRAKLLNIEIMIQTTETERLGLVSASVHP